MSDDIRKVAVMTTLVRVSPAGCSQHFNDMVVWRVRLYRDGSSDPFLAFDVEASIADRYTASQTALAIRGFNVVTDWSLSPQRESTAQVHCPVP